MSKADIHRLIDHLVSAAEIHDSTHRPRCLGRVVLCTAELAAEALGSHLAEQLDRRFASSDKGLIEIVQSAARLALDCIGNSDALYHNVEHTMLVTLAGYDILRGRMLSTQTHASDFAHVIIACLFHDIGYVRGIIKGDSRDGYIIDTKGNKTNLARGSSDAALLSYHVDRSKLFVMDRIGQIEALDAVRIANAIEFTRFPVVFGADDGDNEDGMLVRAADLIGQLGDPHYLRKANALYYEFEEVGMNKTTWLYLAGRSHRSVPAFLLEQHIALHSKCDQLPQRYVEWTVLDCKPLQ